MIEIKFTINANDSINISHDVQSKSPTQLENILQQTLEQKVANLFHDLEKIFNKKTIEELNKSK